MCCKAKYTCGGQLRVEGGCLLSPQKQWEKNKEEVYFQKTGIMSLTYIKYLKYST